MNWQAPERLNYAEILGFFAVVRIDTQSRVRAGLTSGCSVFYPGSWPKTGGDFKIESEMSVLSYLRYNLG